MINTAEQEYPFVLRFFARVISYLFHPLLVGVYMGFYLIFLHPNYFRYVHPSVKFLSLGTIITNNFLFPGLVVLLMKGLGFTQSIELKSQRDRIVPYMASIIFFFWTWYVFYNRPDVPQLLKDVLQGIFYASILGMVTNIYFKVSMHAMGVGGLTGMMWLIISSGGMDSLWPMAFSIILSGIVISSRMILGAHRNGDLVAGFFIGMLAQFIAATIL